MILNQSNACHDPGGSHQARGQLVGFPSGSKLIKAQTYLNNCHAIPATDGCSAQKAAKNRSYAEVWHIRE
jgi:hypothetical protein